jgi:hypothetical protein
LSVSFPPTSIEVGECGLIDESGTNVSELTVANATDESGNQISNPYVVATTFDLTYTGTATPLNSSYVAIRGNASAVTEFWTVAYDYDFPQSMLEKYSANNPGDCTGPLGSACVHALESHNIAETTFDGLHLSAPECADVLGGLSKDVEEHLSEVSPVSKCIIPRFSNIASCCRYLDPAWANATDSPFLWRASAAFSGRSQAALNEELGKMWLIGITTDETDNETGTSSKITSVLCFRVDVNAPTGAAVRLAPGLGVLGALSMLIAVASML